MDPETYRLAIITLARWQVLTRANPEPEKHPREQNTYGLPDGKPIAKVLKKSWRDYLADFLRWMTGHPKSSEIPHHPPLVEKTPNLVQKVTKPLQKYWVEAGWKAAMRLGSQDPDLWKVTNPKLREAVQAQALSLARSTLQTTDQEIDLAKQRLRDELSVGLVDQGEALPKLRERVKAVFERMPDWKADQIAASEASRAVHAAQVLAAKESGVVAGFELLLSADACDLCRRIASEVRQVRIGQAFAVIGDHPDYSTIHHPPLHPHCQCTIVEILKPEYGGPAEPEWGETIQQPQEGLADWKPTKPVPKPKPDLEPPTPKLIPTPKLTPALAPIERFVQIAEQAGVELDLSAYAEIARQVGAERALRIPAGFSPKENKILINEHSENWKNPEVLAAKARRYHAQGWWASGSPDAVIHHEIGHALHYREIKGDWGGVKRRLAAEGEDVRKRIQAEVSQYAVTDGTEFVAEVYSGMKGGKTYSKAIMDLYNEYGGPKA